MTHTDDSPAQAARGARERLLAAAAQNFYATGIAATGIDRIIADAGVAKASLYHHFSSKSDLVLAYLGDRHAEWIELLRARDARAASPSARVLAVFDAYIDHASPDVGRGFRGCGQLNAAAEFPAGDPARALVRSNKAEVEQLLRVRIAEALGPAEEPESTRAAGLAEQFSMLLEGAVARAGLEESIDRLLRAREIAAALLEGAGAMDAAASAIAADAIDSAARGDGAG